MRIDSSARGFNKSSFRMEVRLGLFKWMVNSSIRGNFRKINSILEVGTDEEMGFALAMATHIRSDLELEDITPLEPISPGVRPIDLPVLLGNSVRQLQAEGKLRAAAGMRVWHLTSRCHLNPEFRPFGQKMWRELMRGLPYVEQAANDWWLATGYPLLTDGADQIPYGMNQTDVSNHEGVAVSK